MLTTYVASHTAPPSFSDHSTTRALSFEDDLRDTVYLVDQDCRVRNELSDLLAEFGIRALCFASAPDYLSIARMDSAACLVLDMHSPDMIGIERQLADRSNPPVIFISGLCDIPSTVRAMKAGAIEFLTKPVDPGALIAAVRAAFAQDRRTRQKKADLTRLQTRYCLLTPRERQVFPLIIGGLLNKQAASVLGISEVTFKVHRGRVTQKMEAESFAELVRMAMKLRIPPSSESRPDAGQASTPGSFTSNASAWRHSSSMRIAQ
jgi:FixJ family two-component response regulator